MPNERDFPARFGFTEPSLRRLGIRFRERRALVTTGMIRLAKRDADNARGDLTRLSDAQLARAIYAQVTFFTSGRAVDEEEIERLRAEAERRAGGDMRA